MPTRRRQESKTGFYHVMVRGINREKIFDQPREKSYFKSIILKILKKYEVEIYSYCIMSNHAHFIIRAEIQILSIFMAAVLAEYASYYNYKHFRNGHVFQNRFTSECIESDTYFWTCLRYIHLNPVKVNMAKYPERYEFSSMTEYMRKAPIILHKKAIILYEKHFNNFSVFKEFHAQKQRIVFADITEEKKMQQLDAALVIAEDMFCENQLTLLDQVFEEKAFNEVYIQRLVQKLSISQKRAKELCEDAMKRVVKG